MVLIHEKIAALLARRRLKRRDLAKALGVSPQTATDICKGRSAITLPHLRNLVRFFEVRAEFWLDEEGLVPDELDRLANRQTARSLARTGILQVQDPERLLLRLRTFVQRHRTEFLTAFPDLDPAERQLLGLADPERGTIGQISSGQVSGGQVSGGQSSSGQRGGQIGGGESGD